MMPYGTECGIVKWNLFSILTFATVCGFAPRLFDGTPTSANQTGTERIWSIDHRPGTWFIFLQSTKYNYVHNSPRINWRDQNKIMQSLLKPPDRYPKHDNRNKTHVLHLAARKWQSITSTHSKKKMNEEEKSFTVFMSENKRFMAKDCPN